MRSASEYLKVLEEQAFAGRYGFEVADRRPATEDDFRAAAEVSRHLGHDEVPEAILRTGLGMKALMRQIGADLTDDLADCVRPEQRAFVARLSLGLLPTGIMNAYSLEFDHEWQELDAPIVALNYGLWFSLNLLAEALILENLSDDLAHLQGDGTDFFRYALWFYAKPTIGAVRQLPALAPRLPEEVRSEIGALVGKLSTIGLTFVALHELGHIWHGDTRGSRRRLAIAPDLEHVRYLLPPAEAEHDWALEYGADRFALEGLWYRGQRPESAWANFAQLELLFRFLDEIESRRPSVDQSYHPPALHRLEALRERQVELAGPPREDHSAHLVARVAHWSTAPWSDPEPPTRAIGPKRR